MWKTDFFSRARCTRRYYAALRGKTDLVLTFHTSFELPQYRATRGSAPPACSRKRPSFSPNRNLLTSRIARTGQPGGGWCELPTERYVYVYVDYVERKRVERVEDFVGVSPCKQQQCSISIHRSERVGGGGNQSCTG